ncbi:CD3324 family protein [Brevibacillus gelatini]|uniref:Mor transcription activator domain-containing protein n=1 Tax=Brevibacillus gelatini TaxID=1655277 RepID=A0A3M8B8P7_9BACL|nr:CD3324 family protein [Brevibacillus gelatini]RNB59821.1 hypothetical protein EDM57_04025 [Brevibacillus gelatini]
MKYVNAASMLPETLIAEIQKYVQGELLYIPKPKTSHHKWGTRTGFRKQLDERNNAIRSAFREGVSIQQLATQYFLSPETIKKIVYAK